MVEVLPPETDAQGRPTDADLDWALNAAFSNKHIVGRNPSAEEKNAWMAVARQLREKGKSADDIRQTLIGQMNDAKGRAQDPNRVLPLPTRADGRPTNDDLEWALKEAFTNKHIVGRDPSAEEKNAWMEVANQLREKGKSADDIRQTLVGLMNDANNRTKDPNKVLPLPTRADGRPTDEDLEWALREAFTNKHVVGRPPSSNEFSRWMEVARKLREKGKSADDIRQTLIGQMSQAKDRAEGR
ncbi:hypothetical protein [Archangium sp.]|uniref:hypothetical protein n=1 Tax=Archangium sp. TaxID=1872627 RepID=UPI00286C9232|nr:hypothetical protein [Archangium sp.]